MAAEDPHDSMLQFFAYAHLPDALKFVSQPFHDLAEHVVATLPRNAERTTCLRKLLEAKDCAVRARIYRNQADVHTRTFPQEEVAAQFAVPPHQLGQGE